MELAFIIGVFGTWAVIALVALADKLRGGSRHEESDKEFLDRVWRENAERARKELEEMKAKYG